MIFMGKQLSDINEQDLQKLKDEEIQERDTIEYKGAMHGNSDEERRQMLKDISSMANYHGGYLIIGVEADGEGIPIEIVGVEAGNHVERIQSSCLNNIDKRIMGLQVEDVPLSNGRVVIIVFIPESMNAPHMVTFRDLNQFWKRHGRQKERMTIDEIGEAFDKSLSNLNRLDRFLFTRKAQVLEDIKNRSYMVISASPVYLRDEEIIDISDQNLRGIILNPPSVRGTIGNISCGQPYITLTGLRADQSTPYYYTPSELKDYLEVYRNGYIEYGKLMSDGEKLLFAPKEDGASIVNFILFIEKVYGIYLPLTPLVISFVIYNAKDMWLGAGSHSGDERVTWPKQNLELEKFYVANIAEEAKMLPKRINDRIWQAFHREKAFVFDDEGNLMF